MHGSLLDLATTKLVIRVRTVGSNVQYMLILANVKGYLVEFQFTPYETKPGAMNMSTLRIERANAKKIGEAYDELWKYWFASFGHPDLASQFLSVGSTGRDMSYAYEPRLRLELRALSEALGCLRVLNTFDVGCDSATKQARGTLIHRLACFVENSYHN